MKENISEEKLRQVYNYIVNSNLSLREAAQILNIDKKKLKKIILLVLTEDEITIFNKCMEKNKRKKGEGNVNRKKKEKALNEEKFGAAIQSLAESQITPDMIEEIYLRCQEKKQTKIAKDTLAIKLMELLNYFSKRNEGILKESNGYISSQDVVNMILKNPRLITCDLNKNIIPKCSLITVKNQGEISSANIKIKRNPAVFKKSIKTIEKGR